MIERVKRGRGWILQFLALSPVGDESDGGRCWTSSDMLVPLLKQAMHAMVREEVERELAYLANKKLVEVRRMSGTAARLLGGAIATRLTASGQDLLDGTTTDPGIDLGVAAS